MSDLPSFDTPAEPKPNKGFLDGSSHPKVAFFHLFFKVCALLVYLFGGLFVSNFVIIFVVTVLLVAFDFWTVKNVSGRLLVGLRWWNEVKEDGSNEWIFESRQDLGTVNADDSRIFWYSLYISLFAWGILGFISLLWTQISWLLIVAVAILLNLANVIGYTKCQQDAQKKNKNITNPVRDSMSSILKTTLVNNARSFI